MGKKNSIIKSFLSKRNRRNSPIPVFVVLRTKGRIRYNKFRRYWRRDKLMTRNLRAKIGTKERR